MKIVLATNNNHKVEEFKSGFAAKGLDAEIVTIRQTGFSGDIVEDKDTFEGNALIKAKALAEFTGMIAIADDSGLVVDALGGAPGVFSARYAGENATDKENNEKLLKELENCPEGERSGRFVCVICAYRPDGKTLFVRGESEGEIICAPRGDGNFGYDPIFYYPPFKKTFAEMTMEEKGSISHRGKAIEKLLEQIDFFG